MKKAILTFIPVLFIACAASAFGAHARAAHARPRAVDARSQQTASTKAQASPTATPAPTPVSNQRGAGAGEGAAADGLKLTEAEAELVRGSREAVIAAGLSEAYFDAHFKPLRVFNAPGDRRVVWRFRLNGHEAAVSDTIGYYTDERGRRTDTHSITSALPDAHDITRTITRPRAERIMRSCIGPFDGGAVVYHATGAPAHATLVFTATSIPVRDRRAEREREKREREERERAAKKKKQTGAGGTDVIEEEDEGGGPPIYIGSVDLETGRCTKGLALSGPQPPDSDRRPRERH